MNLIRLLKAFAEPPPPCPSDLEMERHLKRFQCQPWYIKLWRLRCYLSIPTKATWWWIKNIFSDRPPEGFKFFWAIAIGLAQSPMGWYHTMNEVREHLGLSAKWPDTEDDDDIET